MASFSQRMGHKPVRSVMQTEDVDPATLNRLWDVVWTSLGEQNALIEYSPQRRFLMLTWTDFLERTLDTMPTYGSEVTSYLRDRFYKGSWFEMYDALEWVCNEVQVSDRSALYSAANAVLADFLCAYRFVGGELVPLTSAHEVAAIEDALAHPLVGVRQHLQQSLLLLGARPTADASNSVKESISAVESICAAIVGARTTLGAALKELEDNGVVLHTALKKSWIAMYGWTSDEGGIRHALQDESRVSVADASYVLVTCSAFVNMLTDKAIAAGVELKPVE